MNPKTKKPKAEEPPPLKEGGEVIISIRIGECEAESSFSLDLWKSAKVDPSPAQFIVGSLREAMEAKGYKE